MGFWAYFEVRPDGRGGIAGVLTSALGAALPLVTSRESNLATLDAIARSHARSSGFPVELRYFPGPGELLRTFDPKGGG
jgi:hypothetical protein